MNILVETKIGIMPMPMQITKLSVSEIEQLEENLFNAFQKLVELNKHSSNPMKESDLMEKIGLTLKNVAEVYCKNVLNKDLPKLLVPKEAKIIDLKTKQEVEVIPLQT